MVGSRQGEGAEIVKTYEVFLKQLQEALREAIADAENMEWHHMDEGAGPWTHYNRLLGWEEEVTRRLSYYATAATRNKTGRRRRSTGST